LKDLTIVIPHAFTTKWLQIVIASLKSFKNNYSFDILVMDNSPDGNRSIEGITRTRLGNGVKVIKPHPDLRWHAGALDAAIDIIETPFYFATETDCRALQDYWLDRYFENMTDRWTAMVGWFWEVPGEAADRLYINSSATLYRTEILRKLKAETLRNDNFMICYGTDLRRRMKMPDRLIGYWRRGNWGPFQEVRGYQEVFHHRDDKWYHEPGCWLYFRAQCEYECVRIPGKWEIDPETKAAAATWYGVEPDYYYVHYWGGTVSHNWEKHLVVVPWEIRALPFWIERENRIWKEIVDKDVREKTLQMGLVMSEEEEREYIFKNRVHSLNAGDPVVIIDYETDQSQVGSGELPRERWSRKVPKSGKIINQGVCLGLENDGCHIETEQGTLVEHPFRVVKLKGEKYVHVNRMGSEP